MRVWVYFCCGCYVKNIEKLQIHQNFAECATDDTSALKNQNHQNFAECATDDTSALNIKCIKTSLNLKLMTP